MGQRTSMSTDTKTVPSSADLTSFARLLSSQVAVFANSAASSASSDEIPSRALPLLTALFNASLQSEASNADKYSALLQILTDAKPVTRSRSAAASASTSTALELSRTPLNELYIEEAPDEVNGVDANERIWLQLELRLNTLQGLVSKVMGSTSYGVDDDAGMEEEDLAGEEQDSASGSDEEDELENAELEELEEEQSLSDEEHEANESFQPLEKALALPEPPAPAPTKKSKRSRPAADDQYKAFKKRKANPSSTGKASAVDDQFFKLSDFLAQSSKGEQEMERALAAFDEASSGGAGSSSRGRQKIKIGNRVIEDAGDDDDDESDDDEEEVDFFAPLSKSARAKLLNGSAPDADEDDDEEGIDDLGDIAGSCAAAVDPLLERC